MQYRRLGRTGLKLSVIGLGTMQFGWTADQKSAREILDEATSLGINFIDSADIYSSRSGGDIDEKGVSEQIVGNWLSTRSVRRQEIVIATKVRGRMGIGPNDEGLSRHHVLAAARASLKRLQTEYIDLYQVHWPDLETPLEETLTALNDLIRSGDVRYIGCSNFPAWLLAKSLWISDVKGLARFDGLQPHYNLVHRAEFERALQPLCLDQGIGVIPYSPLGGGFLTGKYRPGSPLPPSARAGSIQSRYMNDKGFAAVDKLELIGGAHGASIAQTAIAWILENPAVCSAIIGANSIDQLRDSLKGVDVKLSASEMEMLNACTAWQ